MSSQASSIKIPAWLVRLGQVIRQAPALVAMAVIAVAGSIIALYLTVVHYAAVPLVCNTTGPINCASVLKSSFGVIPGTTLPITFPGMAWFLVSGGMAIAGLTFVWRAKPEPRRLRQAQVAWGFVGLATVFYLVYAEIAVLQHICEWCTGVHILVLATLLLALNRLQAPPTIMPASVTSQSGGTKPVSKAAPSARLPAARASSARTQAKHPATKARTASSSKAAARKHR